jgi:hypothetical protein
VEPAVNVKDDSDGHCRFGGVDADGEQGKEETFEFARVKYAVEYGKVDVNRVEYQLNGDEHRDEVTPRYKTEKANEEEQSAQSQ